MIAKQGHRYHWDGKEVLSLETGEKVRVAHMDRTQQWPLTTIVKVDAGELTPLPQRYYGLEVRG